MFELPFLYLVKLFLVWTIYIIFNMISFSLKTKISFYTSILWLFFSFFIATTYSKLNDEIVFSWFDFSNVYWYIFYILSTPVWIYWIVVRPYNWIKKKKWKFHLMFTGHIYCLKISPNLLLWTSLSTFPTKILRLEANY